MKKLLATLTLLALTLLAGCDIQSAEVASRNISTDSDNFRIQRRIIFLNGITNDYIFTIEGRCSIEVDGADSQLEVTCKVGDNQFLKHFLGLSDNVTYFLEQTEVANVSEYFYKVTFKPSVIVPDLEINR